MLSRGSAAGDAYGGCAEVYLARTGVVRYGKPNKCLAVAQLPTSASSAFFQSIRAGESAGLRGMYQGDYLRRHQPALARERELVGALLESLARSVAQLLAKTGPPIDAAGGRRALVVLVANDGVMDFVLNFACSCRRAGLSVDNVLVFVGGESSVALVEAMGLRAVFMPGLGGMPERAAGNYGDESFTSMMWLKVSAVYAALAAGFEVLFQDTDVVWLRDPLPPLRASAGDAVFMDDGARTIRFTPYFANSGFYFLRRNARTQQLMERMAKSAAELAHTHSHQSTLTRYLTEAQHLCNLDVRLLPVLDFPSGDQYHNDKPFLKAVREGRAKPFVFHMSFTASRADKVRYFADIDMWLVDGKRECVDAQAMAALGGSLVDRCCRA